MDANATHVHGRAVLITADKVVIFFPPLATWPEGPSGKGVLNILCTCTKSSKQGLAIDCVNLVFVVY